MTTTTTTTTTADIQVRLHQILPNGSKIFECRRFLTNCYDKDKKAWIKSTGATMRVATSHLPRAGPLVTALEMTRYFTYSKEEDIVEIVQVSMLPANDPVAINHGRDPQTPETLKVGDILVYPPLATSLSSSPSSPQQLLWKTATLQTVTQARDRAIQAGLSSYLMYFAQSPPTTTTTGLTTAGTATTTTTTPSTIATAKNASPTLITANAHAVALAAAAATSATTTTATTTSKNASPTLITTDAHAAALVAAATATAAVATTTTTTAKNASPTLITTDAHAAELVATAAATTTTTTLAPDSVPSCEMVVEEQLSSTAITGTITTVKRKKTSSLSSSNGATKNKEKQKRHKVDDGDGGRSSSSSEVQELPANVYDKMPPKQRNDTLWQEASTQYESAKALVESLQSGAARLADQYQALHNAVAVFVLPALPAKVEPPIAVTTNGDFAVLFQRVGEYTTALLERNKELEEYIASLDRWKVRVSAAIDKWHEQEEPQQECRDARMDAHEKVEQLKKDVVAATAALVAATAALRQTEVREADTIRADQHALEELVKCFL
jgi:exonuclease VII small subunit